MHSEATSHIDKTHEEVAKATIKGRNSLELSAPRGSRNLAAVVTEIGSIPW